MSSLQETAEQRERRWQAAIERVYNEVTELHHHREIWQYLNQELPKHGGQTIHRTTTKWYIDSQATTVRRLASDRSQDGNSLYNLLQSIDAHVSDFGGERWGEEMTSSSVTARHENPKADGSIG